MPAGRRKLLWNLVRLAVTLLALWFLLRNLDVEEVAESFRATRFRYVLAIAGIAFLDRALMGYKWSLLLRARGIHLPLLRATALYYIAVFLGSFTPAAVGGDAYRVAAVRHLGNTQDVISSVLLERLIGAGALALIATVLLPVSAGHLGPSGPLLSWLVPALAVACFLFVVLSLSRRSWRPVSWAFRRILPITLFERVERLHAAYVEYRSHPATLVVFTVLSLVEVLLIVTVNYLGAWALDVRVSFGYFLAVIPVILIVNRLPVSFHGVGVQEGLFAYFLSLEGFTVSQGLSVALLLRVLEVLTMVLPSLLMLWLFAPATRPAPPARGNASS